MFNKHVTFLNSKLTKNFKLNQLFLRDWAEKEFSISLHIFSWIFSKKNAGNSCKKNRIITFDNIINRKKLNFPGKKQQFLTSKTWSFLRLKLTKLNKPNIPKLSYVWNRRYRTFLTIFCRFSSVFSTRENKVNN